MKKAVINILFCLIVIGLGIIIYKYISEKTEEKYSVSGIISASGSLYGEAGGADHFGGNITGSDFSGSDYSGSDIHYAGTSELSPVTLFVGINPESAAVTGITLEILRCGPGSSLTCIGIPSDSRFTMSEELYRKLSALLPQMPQIATLSETFHYFGIKALPSLSADDGSEVSSAMTALTLMLSELAGTKVSSYVLVNSDTFEDLFGSPSKVQGSAQSGGESGANSALLLSESNRHLELFREIWASAFTNVSLNGRLVYLETFDALRSSDITLLYAEGERTNFAFQIDKNSLTLRVYNAMNK